MTRCLGDDRGCRKTTPLRPDAPDPAARRVERVVLPHAFGDLDSAMVRRRIPGAEQALGNTAPPSATEGLRGVLESMQLAAGTIYSTDDLVAAVLQRRADEGAGG